MSFHLQSKKCFLFVFQNPAVVLLTGVYLFIFFVLLSYDHAWMHPEEFSIKSYVTYHGPPFQSEDVKRGLNYQAFEYTLRWTRPLSSYFEIMDTKFRVWLWNYFLPHPSLSLTWIFSLILSPLFLYRFLRNWQLGRNLALSCVCLYLLNPGVLSFVVMLFRPAKAMTNFSIIGCLYGGSCLYRYYRPSGNTPIPRDVPRMIQWSFWALLFFIFSSFFWDETAILIYPAMVFFFPGFWKDRKRLMMYLCLPVLLIVFYYAIIPAVTHAAGYPTSGTLTDYIRAQTQLASEHPVKEFFQNFFTNAALLFSESWGIVPLHAQSPWPVKAMAFLGAGSLGLLSYLTVQNLRISLAVNQVKKIFLREMSLWGFGLTIVLVFHGALMAITNHVWGLFWYGAYFSIFFVIGVARVLYFAQINRYAVTLCMGLILLNLGAAFIGTNQVYKKYHFYPFAPHRIGELFTGKMKRYDHANTADFSSARLRHVLGNYWFVTKKGEVSSKRPHRLPKELLGMAIEVEPGKHYYQHRFLVRDKDKMIFDLDQSRIRAPLGDEPQN